MSRPDRTSLDLPVLPEEQREWPEDGPWLPGQRLVLVLLVRPQAEGREADWRACYLYRPGLVQFPQ